MMVRTHAHTTSQPGIDSVAAIILEKASSPGRVDPTAHPILRQLITIFYIFSKDLKPVLVKWRYRFNFSVSGDTR